MCACGVVGVCCRLACVLASVRVCACAWCAEGRSKGFQKCPIYESEKGGGGVGGVSKRG